MPACVSPSSRGWSGPPRPVPATPALASVKRDDVDDMALGPLQPVGGRQDQAAALRSAVVSRRALPAVEAAVDRMRTAAPAPAAAPRTG